MAVFSIVRRTSIGSASRIDPDYYQPEYLQLATRLSKSVLKEKGILRKYIHSAINFGAYSLCNYIVFVDSGVPYLYTQDIRDNYIDLDNLHFITPEVDELLYKSRVRDRQVVLTMAGVYLGRASVFDYGIHANSNQATAKITVREDLLNPYYLSTFLNSLYGSFQIQRNKTGTARDNINLGQIQDLFICIPSREFQLRIEQLVKAGKQKLVASKQSYTQAEQLLLSELGLQDWKSARALTFVRGYSQAAKAGRMDAEYYHPKYDELRERIRQYPNGFLRITDIAANSDETVEPTAHAEDDYRYIELADINQVIGTIESANEIKGKDAPSRARMLLRAGDVIASSVEGSLDKVALVSEEYHGAIGSTGFFVLRPRAVQSGYLLALVKSIIVREQMRCEASGTILAAVPAKSLRNIIVPNIPPEKRDEIAQLVEKSHAARREAKALLEKAKRAIEIAIENGEDKAMEFIAVSLQKREAA